MSGALRKPTAGRTSRPPLCRLASDADSGALREMLAQPLPAHVSSLALGGVGALGEHGHDGQNGVNGVVTGLGPLHTVLHREAAVAAQDSSGTEPLPLGKGCDPETAITRKRTDWTEERITALGDLFEAGWSHELMGQALGLSKGSISAKLDRLAEADPKKWTRSATIHSIRPDRSALAAKAEERRAHAASAKALEESVVGVTLLALEPCMCRWPLAYTTEQTFCAADRVGRSSYCCEHDTRSRVRGGA